MLETGAQYAICKLSVYRKWSNDEIKIEFARATLVQCRWYGTDLHNFPSVDDQSRLTASPGTLKDLGAGLSGTHKGSESAGILHCNIFRLTTKTGTWRGWWLRLKLKGLGFLPSFIILKHSVLVGVLWYLKMYWAQWKWAHGVSLKKSVPCKCTATVSRYNVNIRPQMVVRRALGKVLLIVLIKRDYVLRSSLQGKSSWNGCKVSVCQLWQSLVELGKIYKWRFRSVRHLRAALGKKVFQLEPIQTAPKSDIKSLSEAVADASKARTKLDQ